MTSPQIRRTSKRLLNKSTNNPFKITRAIPSDAKFIEDLINADVRIVFGDVDANEILCNGFLTLLFQYPEIGITSAMSFDNFPNIPTLCSSHWQRWLVNLYKIEGVTSKNSLWAHLVAYNSDYGDDFLLPILKYIFTTHQTIKYVLFLVPPKCHPLVPWLKGNITRIQPVGLEGNTHVQVIYMAAFQNIVNKYKIRKAVEEDNDDLVPLINLHSTRLRELYGEFYVAEILTRHQSSGRQLIVAEHKDEAVALLCLNDTVNYDQLNECFELEPFNGLHVPDDVDKLLSARTSLVIPPEFEEVTIYKSNFPIECCTEDKLHNSLVMKNVVVVDNNNQDQYNEHYLNDINDKYSEDSDDVHDESSTISNESEEVETSEESEQVSSDSLLSIDMQFDEDESVFFFGDRSSKQSDDTTKQNSQPLSCQQLSRESLLNNLSFSQSDVELDKRINQIKQLEEIEEMENIPIIEKYYPKYEGEKNAFALELIASWPDNEDAIYHLLVACFECFPTKEYCVLSIPSTIEPFPALTHFVKVTPRNTSSYKQELYVLNKYSISSGVIFVRLAKKVDYDKIECFIKKVKWHIDLLTIFKREMYLKNRIYILFCGSDIIGACIIKQIDDVEHMRKHYDLEEMASMKRHKYGSVGEIEHYIMSPIFQAHARFFLKELHRLSEFTLLVFKVYCSDNNQISSGGIAACIANLIPIKPKKRLSEEKSEPFTEYSLYISTTYLCSMPKYDINAKIVIVGGSVTSTAFLEQLLFPTAHKYHAIFTSVTIISPNSLSHMRISNRSTDNFFVTQSNYTDRYIRMINFGSYVNFCSGVMTGIDRKNKRLVVNSNTMLPYDFLFLLCGEQFPKPIQLKQNHYLDFPHNIYIINTQEDAFTALHKLKKQISLSEESQPYNIIIHGACLEAYACITALLEHGIPNNRIVYVESTPTLLHNFTFPDGEVDEAVIDHLRSIGITVYMGYNLVDWGYDVVRKRITTAKFESNKQMIDIDCLAIFLYLEKCVSSRTFYAINRAGLVFDGRLVISADYRTNDAFIYAAGTLTKYSRKYYADHMIQKFYNREEVGTKLAIQMRKTLIPFYDERGFEDSNNIECTRDKIMPRFCRPLFVYMKLPGGLYYYHVNKPGHREPLETQMTDEYYGQVFLTGNPKKLERQGYFKLHLNQFNSVETITCLSKHAIDYNMITTLYGKHERLLNHLVLRFEMVLIPDFYEYFKEPWAMTLYHNEYNRCEMDTRNILINLKNTDGKLLIENIMEQLSKTNYLNLVPAQRRALQQQYRNAGYVKLLEEKVLSFIGDNLEDFPIYAHPIMVRMLLQGAENSPLFTRS